MSALLIDVAPSAGGSELLAVIALVIVAISVVTVVALATGAFHLHLTAKEPLRGRRGSRERGPVRE